VLPYEYLWDLSDSKFVFSLPLGRFESQQSKEGWNWSFEAQLQLDDRLPPLRARPDAKNQFIFKIEGVTRDKLLTALQQRKQ
jgi:hypothetical protein